MIFQQASSYSTDLVTSVCRMNTNERKDMKDTLKPKVNQVYTVERFDNEVLLYSEVDTQAVYLNDAAYAVWQLCQGDLTIGQIVEYLEETFPAQKQHIRGDVIMALKTLEKNNVIELSDD